MKSFSIQNAVFAILFAIGFFAGGAASAANAADVQDTLDVISFIGCDFNPTISEICDNLEVLRNSMAAAAVSFSTSELPYMGKL